MPWQYNQSSGEVRKDGILVDSDSYSGAWPEGFNQSAKETIPGVGPIMAGEWTIEGLPYTDAKLGSYVLRLTPSKEVRARLIQCGRDPDSFRWHGKPLPPRDIRSGSDGCICSQRATRVRVYQSGDRSLNVVSGLPMPDLDGEIAV